MTRKQHVTAIIYDKKGRVLSIGQNSYMKTHPLQAKHAKKVGLGHKQYLHAEISAIVRCKDLSKAHTIEVCRFGCNHQPLNAKPCPICASAIKAAGIRYIKHT